MTSEECLANADEAEAMAQIVSLGTDKDRLMHSAEAWRRRAAEVQRSDTDAASERPVWRGRFRKGRR